MTIIGKYFPGQTPSERVFLVLRRSVFTYVVFLAFAVLMLMPLVVLMVYYSWYPDFFSTDNISAGITLAVSAYLLFILGLLLRGFVDYYLDVYIITDERIVDIKQIGFFKREISELHLREVQDVSARVNGFFPTVFHFGDVVIQTAGERENFVFNAVPHPYQVAKKIADLHEAQIEHLEYSSISPKDRGKQEPEKGEEEKSNTTNESDKIGEKPEVKVLKREFFQEEAPEIKSELSMPNSQFNTPSAGETIEELGLSKDEINKGAKTNIDQGLKQIDNYIEKERSTDQKIKKEIELREGKEARIDEVD